MDSTTDRPFQNLRVEKHGATALIIIDRPKVLNALDVQTLTELHDAIDAAGRSPDIRGIVLTGEGRAFVAGADIEHLSTLGPIEAHAFSALGARTMHRIETLNKPVIAAVNGFALGGGCELALACDFIVASTKAKFGQPEVNLGVIPGFGGTQRLSRLIGKNLARFMIYTGDMFDAVWAQQHGLVAEVVEPDALRPRCLALVEIMAKRGPLAISAAKRVIHRGYNLESETAIELEAFAFGELFASADAREGMTAFLTKRSADFTGR
jgi:enoyl-CoA hydratase